MSDLLARARAVSPMLVVECGHKQILVDVMDTGDLTPMCVNEQGQGPLSCCGPQLNTEALVRIAEAAAHEVRHRDGTWPLETGQECEAPSLAAALTGEEREGP